MEEARQNHVNIRLEAPEKKYPLNFDGNEMKRVFDNLFSNTIRYRENEDSHVLIRITRHMKKPVSRSSTRMMVQECRKKAWEGFLIPFTEQMMQGAIQEKEAELVWLL